jgi:hypothetical protein
MAANEKDPDNVYLEGMLTRPDLSVILPASLGIAGTANPNREKLNNRNPRQRRGYQQVTSAPPVFFVLGDINLRIYTWRNAPYMVLLHHGEL